MVEKNGLKKAVIWHIFDPNRRAFLNDIFQHTVTVSPHETGLK